MVRYGEMNRMLGRAEKISLAADCQLSQGSDSLRTDLLLQDEVVDLLSAHEVSQLLQHLLPLVVDRHQGVQGTAAWGHPRLVPELRLLDVGSGDESQQRGLLLVDVEGVRAKMPLAQPVEVPVDLSRKLLDLVLLVRDVDLEVAPRDLLLLVLAPDEDHVFCDEGDLLAVLSLEFNFKFPVVQLDALV